MTSTTLIMEVGDGQDLRSWMLSPDGNIVAHTQKSTFLWDIEKEDEILQYQKNKKMGFKKYIGIPVEFIENGKKLLVINDDELVIYNSDDAMLLDQTNMKIATTYGQSYEDKLLFSPDEKFFLVAGRQEENDQEIVSLDVYKTQTLTKILSFPSDLQDSKEYFHYDWSQNGRFIVKYCASCKDDGVIIYDVEEKEAVPTQTVDSQTTTSSDTGGTLDKLRKLKDLYDEGVLSDEEYERLKKEILDSNSD
ncbi:MAG: SHOCT domain-containing protein [Cyclobacteriaceae bacterium]